MPAIGLYMMASTIGVGPGTPCDPKDLLPQAITLLLSRATIDGFTFQISLGAGDRFDFPFIDSVIDAFPYDCAFMRDLVEADAWWRWGDSGPANAECPYWWKYPEDPVVGPFPQRVYYPSTDMQ